MTHAVNGDLCHVCHDLPISVVELHEPSANRGLKDGIFCEEQGCSVDGRPPRPQHVSSPAGDMSAAVDLSQLISPDEHYTAPARNVAVCVATPSSLTHAGLGTDIGPSQQVDCYYFGCY